MFWNETKETLLKSWRKHNHLILDKSVVKAFWVFEAPDFSNMI